MVWFRGWLCGSSSLIVWYNCFGVVVFADVLHLSVVLVLTASVCVVGCLVIWLGFMYNLVRFYLCLFWLLVVCLLCSFCF